MSCDNEFPSPWLKHNQKPAAPEPSVSALASTPNDSEPGPGTDLDKLFATVDQHRLFFWAAAIVALGVFATTPLGAPLAWIVVGGLLWWVVKAVGRGWRGAWEHGSGKYVR